MAAIARKADRGITSACALFALPPPLCLSLQATTVDHLQQGWCNKRSGSCDFASNRLTHGDVRSRQNTAVDPDDLLWSSGIDTSLCILVYFGDQPAAGRLFVQNGDTRPGDTRSSSWLVSHEGGGGGGDGSVGMH